MMKTRQLLAGIVILALSSCKKDIATGELAKSMQKPGLSSRVNALSNNLTSDSYKISEVVTTYPLGAVGGSRSEKANYIYNVDGKISKIVNVITQKTRVPKQPVTQPVTFDTLTFITNNTTDYSYTQNTVRAKWVSIQNDRNIGHWESTYVFDAMGKVVKDTIRIFNTNPNNGISTTPRIYNYQNLVDGNGKITLEETGFVYTYNSLAGNFTNALQGVTTQTNTASYNFYNDKDWQPADAITLNQQQSEYGYASLISKNLSQSASANLAIPGWDALFFVSYGIVMGPYASSVDVKFAYEYDDIGRVIKIIDTGRPDRKATTPYQILRIRLITYLN